MNAYTKNLVITAATQPVGRPPKYSGDLLPIANSMARLGATDEELQDILGVHQTTINKWRRDHPEFYLACKEGKAAFDEGIVRKLARKAMGYTTKRQKHHFDKDTGRWHVLEYEEEVPPDTTAMIYWLKNRMPREWRDRIDVGGDLNHNVNHTGITDPRMLAMAVLNLMSDAQRVHKQGSMIDVTPNQGGHEVEGADASGQAENSDVRRTLRPDEGRAEGGAVAPEGVAKQPELKRRRR